MTPNGGGGLATLQHGWDDSAWMETAAFARRFGTQHSLLAMHAAVPLGLTPELVHLIRVNFAPRAEWIAEADLLLSPLSQEVSAGLYLLDPGARDLLMSELLEHPDFGQARLRETATFLYAYTDRAIRSETDTGLLRFLKAQQWAARGTLDPDGTAQELARQLGEAIGTEGAGGSAEIAGLIRSLAGPLFMESDLLLYAAGVERLAAGDRFGAEARLGLLDELGIDVKVGEVELPPPGSFLARPGHRQRVASERPRRVHIAYDLETGDAIERRELPFVVGVLADLAGHGTQAELRERRFVEVASDNVDQVMAKMEPRLRFAVDNRLADVGEEAGRLMVDLAFHGFEDFEPRNVVAQVEPLARLTGLSGELARLREQVRRNRGLEEALLKAMEDPDLLSELALETEDRSEEMESPTATAAAPPRIWVCSVPDRLTAHRSRVIRAASALEARVETRALEPASPLMEADVVRKLIASCDLVVGLVPPSRGDPRGADGRSAVEVELELAWKSGIDTLVFVQEGGAEEGQGPPEPDFAAWRASLSERAVVGTFGADPESVRFEPAYVTWRSARRGRASQGGGLLDEVIEQARGTDAGETRDLVRAFVNDVLEQGSGPPTDALQAIDERLGVLDDRCTRQLDAILHHPDFQALETAWRGLKYLLDQTQTGPMLRVRVLTVKKEELARDLASAGASVEGSRLFRMVVEEEWAQFGGTPYSLLIGAYDFDHSEGDVEMLGAIARIAAQAHAPFVAAAAPGLLGLDSFHELGGVRDAEKIFGSSEYRGWRALRDAEESRYLCLTLPRVLLRQPHEAQSLGIPRPSPEGGPGPGYNETVSSDALLWGTAAWALGARITESFGATGWLARIRGVEGGGLVEDLPAAVLAGENGDLGMVAPTTQAAVTDRLEHDLALAGLVPLVYRKGTNSAAFLSVNTVHALGRGSSQLQSVQLPYILCASRFAHHVAALVRDSIGAYRTPEDLERALNNWIMDYVRARGDMPEAHEVKRPLADAMVNIEEDQRSGARRAVLHLTPAYQLDPMESPMTLVVDLPGMPVA